MEDLGLWTSSCLPQDLETPILVPPFCLPHLLERLKWFEVTGGTSRSLLCLSVLLLGLWCGLGHAVWSWVQMLLVLGKPSDI